MTGTQFKTIRTRLKKSQMAIAKLLGVSQGSVTNWENGYRDIPADAAETMEELKWSSGIVDPEQAIKNTAEILRKQAGIK